MATDKVSKGVALLQEQGHKVEACSSHGKRWWEIDDTTLATREEIEHVADGVYSLAELTDLFIRRRKEELGEL